MRIVSKDEWILRLPWNLLAFQGIFLSAAGWSISVSAKLENIDCLLPPCPRLLIIAPELAGVKGTGAKDHLKVLNNILKKTNGQYEQTVEELKKLRLEAWRVEGGDERGAGKKTTNYDY